MKMSFLPRPTLPFQNPQLQIVLNRIIQYNSLMCFICSSVLNTVSNFFLPFTEQLLFARHHNRTTDTMESLCSKWRRQIIKKEIHNKQASYRFWRVIESKQGVIISLLEGGGVLTAGRSVLGVSQPQRGHVRDLKEQKHPAE